ncbi:MAG: putative 2OG-Fe(II) oxygenase [Alphaproteobacteria bacterium]|nr:putative 2OG-Fe(II) oxygenase [Alphaproteobacteria bacterium]
MMRYQAHISLETEADNALAADAAHDAVALATDPAAHAAALADLGKALLRQGYHDAAEQHWRTALALDPGQSNAIKRLAALMLPRGGAAELLHLCDKAVAAGKANSRVLAAKALALANLGRIDEARAVSGWDRFFHQSSMPPPPGWESLAAFNAALATAMLVHPALRYDRYGSASSKTWRVDEPSTGGSPLVAALEAHIAQAVNGWIGMLEGTDHPWLAAMPQRRVLHSWCVLTDGVGHETWHVHQFGWLSGVYYVTVPDAIRAGDDKRGCIGFGLDEALAGRDAAAAYGIDVVRPEQGMLLLFPSHCYHRTWPHQSDERRIAFAFDVRAG